MSDIYITTDEFHKKLREINQDLYFNDIEGYITFGGVAICQIRSDEFKSYSTPKGCLFYDKKLKEPLHTQIVGLCMRYDSTPINKREVD